MADITLDYQTQGATSTPAASSATILVDSSDARLKYKLPDGTFKVLALRGVFNVVDDYGAVGDMRTVFDGACNSAANTKITSATAAFVAADVGKKIVLPFAGASGATYSGTITAIDSTTQVTVSPAISTTTSARGLSIGTDDTTAWQNCLNAAQNATYPGAAIVVPVTTTNRFMITGTLTISKGGFTIEGIGRAHTSDIGDYTKSGGSTLCWAGTTSAILLQIAPVAGASNTALQAPLIRGLNFDCRNGDQSSALYGIQMLSAHGFHLADVFINDALAVGLDLGVIAGALGEAKDLTRGTIENCCFRQLDKDAAVTLGSTTTTGSGTFTVAPFSLAITAGTNFTTAGYVWVAGNLGYPVLVQYTGGGGTTTLTGCTVDAQEVINAPTWVAAANVVQANPSNGIGIRLDGGTAANACCSVMSMLQISHGTTWGPAAIEFRNADSWQCTQVVINGGNITNDGAVNRQRKPGVRFNGSNSNAALASRNVVFRGGSAGVGGVSVMGSLNTGVRLSAMAGPIYWDLYELGNGEGIPVVENSASFEWTPNGGFALGAIGATSIADQAVPIATLTLITGSLVPVPPQGFQIGTKLHWKLRCTKTAAGAAARSWFLRIGTAGTTADGIVATFTSGLPTGVADNAEVDIDFTVRTLGAAATGKASLTLCHNLAATGFASIPTEVTEATMATWNSTTAQLFISLSLTTGALEAITVTECSVACINPANP